MAETRERAVPVTMGSPRFESCSTPGLDVVHAWFPAEAVLPRHSHDRTNVLVMLRGRFDLAIRGRTITCSPATIAVEPRGEPHANRLGSGGAEVLVLQPDPDRPEAWQRFGDRLDDLRAGRSEVARSVARRLAQEFGNADALAPLAREALAMELLVLAHRESRDVSERGPQWLARVLEMLTATDGAITLAEMAAEVGRHPAHVARTFRRHVGCSVGSWVRRRRLDAAAKQVADSGSSLAAIAMEAGFADQSHFTRAFRQQFGTTPAAYRRMHGGPA